MLVESGCDVMLKMTLNVVHLSRAGEREAEAHGQGAARCWPVLAQGLGSFAAGLLARHAAGTWLCVAALCACVYACVHALAFSRPLWHP